MNVNDAIVDALVYVHSYASNIDDWVRIKKELLKLLQPHQRAEFSTRDPITKAQVPNELERCVATLWEEMTGRPVIFSSDERRTG